ncbi:MAG: BspA family leucine-rich repeat surface protein [Spirochaetaceae bacterium]
MKKLLLLIIITLTLLAGCKKKPITREELNKKIERGEDVTEVNVSEITDMSGLFENNTEFNQDISGWDVSHVTNMSSLFKNSSFNGDISGWDVRNVTNMSSLFQGSSFSGDISQWDTHYVEDMSRMFYGTTQFNRDIFYWDTHKVKDMSDFNTASHLADDFCPPWLNPSQYPDDDTQTMSEGEKELFILQLSHRKPNASWEVTNFFKDTFGSTYEDKMYRDEDLYPFNEIDPYFFEWLRRIFPLPSPHGKMSILTRKTYHMIYHEAEGVRNYFRHWALEYVLIKQEENAFQKAALTYIDYPSNDHLGSDCEAIPLNRTALLPLAGDIDMDRYFMMNIIRTTLVRRMIDGSFNSGWFLLYDILNLYDRAWLAELERAAPYAFEDTAYTAGVCQANLNVHTEPHLTAETVGTLPAGASLSVIARTGEQTPLEEKSGYWYLVDSGELRGWGFSPFIDLADKTPEEVIPYVYQWDYLQTRKLEKNTGLIVNGYEQVFQEPGFDSPFTYLEEYANSVIALEKVKAYRESKSGYWYKIQYEDDIGYLFTDKEPVPNFIGDMVINDDRVNIRKGPGLDSPVLTQLNRGDEIIPLEKDKQDQIGEWNDHWYKIQLPDGEIGYVYGPFISFRYDDKITDGDSVTFDINTEADAIRIGNILSNTNEHHYKWIKVFAADEEETIESLLEENENFSLLYREELNKMKSHTEKQMTEKDWEVVLYKGMIAGEIEPYFGIKQFKLGDRTFATYTVSSVELVDSSGIRTQYKVHGILAINPDGTVEQLSWEFEEEHPSDGVWAPCDMEVYRITDLDKDGNPELWCDVTYYESGYSFIRFLTENNEWLDSESRDYMH